MYLPQAQAGAVFEKEAHAMQPDFNRLRVFYFIYRQKSVAGAAKRLHVTQSAVSQHLQKLERELKVQLFIRLHKRLVPTAAADQLYRTLQPFVDDLDDVVHDLYRRVSAAIDCTKCANCCKTVRPVLDGGDIKNCSAGLGITPEEFQTEYLKPYDEPGNYVFQKIPCPLLKSDRCSIYRHRPKTCRSYPHLHKEDFVSRLWGVIDNCAVCPIVYNVYEQLKAELWHHGDDDDLFDDFEDIF